MTTDTTSVDALRTRLARAFEVAALRDPSAELAAFEAAVRREHGERIAKALGAAPSARVGPLGMIARSRAIGIARNPSPTLEARR